MKEQILKAYSDWTGNDATEQDFNEYLNELQEDMESTGALEIDNIINAIPEVKFDYCTWLCDSNSDDVIIQISVPIKGGHTLIIDSVSDVPFHDLETCVNFIEDTNKSIDTLFRITDYTDIGGDKTQIIIDHNIK